MSKRTSEANKAIRLAWQREQHLVRNGKGTRDWTVAQQQDILDPEKGKAYDDNGRAFEGQHMKSVEKYPEYQGDPENIQLLTREEHLDAHLNNWKKQTNGYYDPVLKQTFNFGDNKYTPCPIIELRKPIIAIKTKSLTVSKDGHLRKRYCYAKRGGICMNEGMTIRDPDAMEKFAAEVETYCAEMKNACNSLKNGLSSAESGMKDRVSRKALQRVEQLAEDLLAGLPAVEGTAEMLKKAAKPLKRARTLM